MKFKDRMSGIGLGIMLAAALSFLLTVYAPLEMFLGSQEDFWFGLAPLGKVCLTLFAICFAGLVILFFLLRLWGKLPLSIGLAVGLTLFCACYIQGNFMVANLPSIDGTAVDWNAYPLQRWLSVSLFVLLFALLLFLLIKFKKVFEKTVLFVSAGLTAMLVITLSTLMLTTSIIDKEGYLRPTDKGDFTYSTDQNLIILITDAMDSGEFLSALEENKEFSDTFDDFTYFDDALAGYPYTRNSLPLILTGKWCENDCSYEEYVSDAFQKSPLIEKLSEENYRIGLYNDGELVFDAATYDGVFENQINVTPHFTNAWDAFNLVFKMTAIRYAPWDLKNYGYDAVSYSDSIRQLPEVEYGNVKKKNTLFYQAISNEDAITLTEQKCARIIHIEGGHVPFIYNKEVQVVKNGTYRGNIEATLTICDAFLKKLKDSDVYDNSVIVILGDHGFNNTGDGSLVRRIHPALMIKGIGETGEQMKKDSTPLSYEQLADAFAKLTDGTPSADVFDENAYPNGRHFIAYQYLYEHTMEKYYVPGKANEFDKMQPTGEKYLLEK